MGKLLNCFIPILLFIFFAAGSFAQTKTCEITTYGKTDTTLWYGWKRDDVKKMKLPDLTKTNDSLHFRFWTETQAVDIWTNDHKVFNGILSNFTNSYDRKHKKPSKFYCRTIPIDTSSARKVYKIFSDASVFQIPTSDKIKGWDQGEDGEEFLIEYSTATFYSFKNYWTPSYFKDLKEAIAIDKLEKDLSTLLNMNKSSADFCKSLPKGCYRRGELAIMCK